MHLGASSPIFICCYMNTKSIVCQLHGSFCYLCANSYVWPKFIRPKNSKTNSQFCASFKSACRVFNHASLFIDPILQHHEFRTKLFALPDFTFGQFTKLQHNIAIWVLSTGFSLLKSTYFLYSWNMNLFNKVYA